MREKAASRRRRIILIFKKLQKIQFERMFTTGETANSFYIAGKKITKKNVSFMKRK